MESASTITPDHRITSLFAASNIADGMVITELHRQHRAVNAVFWITQGPVGSAVRGR